MPFYETNKSGPEQDSYVMYTGETLPAFTMALDTHKLLKTDITCNYINISAGDDRTVLGCNSDLFFLRVLDHAANPCKLANTWNDIKELSNISKLLLDNTIDGVKISGGYGNTMGYTYFIDFRKVLYDMYEKVSASFLGTPLELHITKEFDECNIEDAATYKAAKAADGKMLYRFDKNHTFILYPGMIPNSKGDIITITVFPDIFCNTSYFTKFDVLSKKNKCIISTYARFLYI